LFTTISACFSTLRNTKCVYPTGTHSAIIDPQEFLQATVGMKLPMAGLEPARAFYGPTRINGKGRRFFLPIRRDAETKAQALRTERRNQGTNGALLPGTLAGRSTGMRLETETIWKDSPRQSALEETRRTGKIAAFAR
jgi:hypothetical protein